MRERRQAVIAGSALVLVTAGVLVWRADPFEAASPWVPTCTDLASRLQADLGGGWTVTDPDEYREKNGHRSSSTCVISFVTADQKYTGTIDMFAVGASDPDAARKDVASFRCGDSDGHAQVPEGYHAFRVCSLTNSTYSRVSVHAAKADRRVTMAAKVNVRDDGQAATAYAQDLSRLAADEALTIAEPE